jgi:hypothetical protein
VTTGTCTTAAGPSPSPPTSSTWPARPGPTRHLTQARPRTPHHQLHHHPTPRTSADLPRPTTCRPVDHPRTTQASTTHLSAARLATRSPTPARPVRTRRRCAPRHTWRSGANPSRPTTSPHAGAQSSHPSTHGTTPPSPPRPRSPQARPDGHLQPTVACARQTYPGWLGSGSRPIPGGLGPFGGCTILGRPRSPGVVRSCRGIGDPVDGCPWPPRLGRRGGHGQAGRPTSASWSRLGSVMASASGSSEYRRNTSPGILAGPGAGLVRERRQRSALLPDRPRVRG